MTDLLNQRAIRATLIQGKLGVTIAEAGFNELHAIPRHTSTTLQIATGPSVALGCVSAGIQTHLRCSRAPRGRTGDLCHSRCDRGRRGGGRGLWAWGGGASLREGGRAQGLGGGCQRRDVEKSPRGERRNHGGSRSAAGRLRAVTQRV